MKIFLIDFENVHSEGISGIDFLRENDEVVIFYSNNADSISFEMMHKLMFCKGNLSYFKVRRGGRNALDFQMASYLGYLIHTYHNEDTNYDDTVPDVEFYLISKDSGFDFIIDFWESGNINIKPKIKRFYAIKAAFANQNRPKPVIRPAPVMAKLPPVVESVLAVAEPVEVVHTVAEVLAAVESVAEELAEVAATAKEVVAVSGEFEGVPPEEVVKEVVEAVVKEKPVRKPRVKKVVEIVEVEEVEEVEVIEEIEETAEIEIGSQDEQTFADMSRLIGEAKSSHGLYISMVKFFGQKRGVELYHEAKPMYYAARNK